MDVVFVTASILEEKQIFYLWAPAAAQNLDLV